MKTKPIKQSLMVWEKVYPSIERCGVFKTTREGRDAFNRFLKQCDIDVK